MLIEADRPVRVDLSGVTFFCAAGVTWLVNLRAAVRTQVRIVAISDDVREVLDVCGVSVGTLEGDLAPSLHPADSLREMRDDQHVTRPGVGPVDSVPSPA